MSDTPIVALTEDQALEKLQGNSFGRIGVRHNDDVEVLPLNYVIEDRKIYFRTAEGTKLSLIAANPRVAFQTDEVGVDSAWSVLVKGSATRVTSTEEENHAEGLGLEPWVPTLKYNWVRIDIESIEGRAFDLGPEPARY
ncbi:MULTISPECIES: pyridoxamine 5'-phosphate oxidase family protein [Corynebacterium]|uniref:pyridoxamine 5'-phosphate oxidase family protein n=1 Tax=Corynebacterium TaxID=1716 RepID=UPI0008A560D2|nr:MULTISPECIES: pyridoxamine 5'-phosphate oxidase family protein [Corynebacterium]MCT1563716.1 pyridoxamine 5'-phosphate oxidase family protein [Corynebacterium glucuronolyticum]OFO49666.1 pyridoxamine 5-phosphate oxidase [Corynebacterium sp. HMSC073D01]QQU88983.1 pyridoxamine 5'-phosphate oxidase family protein [Corynebacterium glucuronolyticum]